MFLFNFFAAVSKPYKYRVFPFTFFSREIILFSSHQNTAEADLVPWLFSLFNAQNIACVCMIYKISSIALRGWTDNLNDYFPPTDLTALKFRMALFLTDLPQKYFSRAGLSSFCSTSRSCPTPSQMWWDPRDLLLPGLRCVLGRWPHHCPHFHFCGGTYFKKSNRLIGNPHVWHLFVFHCFLVCFRFCVLFLFWFSAQTFPSFPVLYQGFSPLDFGRVCRSSLSVLQPCRLRHRKVCRCRRETCTISPPHLTQICNPSETKAH